MGDLGDLVRLGVQHQEWGRQAQEHGDLWDLFADSQGKFLETFQHEKTVNKGFIASKT